MAKRIRALITTGGEGHLSIGEAIRDFLVAQPDFEVEFVMVSIPLKTAYLAVYQFFPSSYRAAFALSKKSLTLRNAANTLFKSRYDDELRAAFEKFKPDVVINTFYVCNPSLEELCAINHVPLFNIITDPLSLHVALVANPPALNCCFDVTACRVIKNIDKLALTAPMGWFVRDRFEESYNKKRVRQQLQLDPDTLTILVASGSEGTNLVMKILPILLLSDRPAQVVVACGNNGMLKSLLEQFSNVLDATGNHNKLIILGFTQEIDKYMQAADLVIGKAGPNSLFESVATRTPFFAITHISGQEDGNLDIIRKKRLGYVEENLVKLLRMLKGIIDNPKQLERFAKPLDAMARYNSQSKALLLREIRKLAQEYGREQKTSQE